MYWLESSYKPLLRMHLFVNILLHLALFVLGLIALSRLLGLFISSLLSTLLKIKVSIERVGLGLFTLNNILIDNNNGVVIVIDQINLTTWYIPWFGHSKRPFGLLLGKVQVVITDLSSSNKKSNKSNKEPSLSALVLFLLQRLHVSIGSITVKVAQQPSLLLQLLITDGLSVVCYPTIPTEDTPIQKLLSTHLSLDNIIIRLIDESKVQPVTYLDTSFGLRLDALLPTKNITTKQMVIKGVMQPLSILIYEGLFECLKKLDRDKPSNVSDILPHLKEPLLTRLVSVIQRIPKQTRLSVEKVSCSISDVRETRNFSFKLDCISEEGVFEQSMTETFTLSGLKVFVNQTPTLSLSKVVVKPQLSGLRTARPTLDVKSVVENLSVKWYNTELINWLSSLPTNSLSTPPSSAPDTSLTSLTVNATAELMNLTASFVVDQEALLSFSLPLGAVNISKSEEYSSGGLQLKQCQLYLPMSDKAVKSSNKAHTWGTVLYLQSSSFKVLYLQSSSFKVRKQSHDLHISIDVTHPRLEWSEMLARVVMEIMPQLVTLKSSMPMKTNKSVSKRGPLSVGANVHIQQANLFVQGEKREREDSLNSQTEQKSGRKSCAVFHMDSLKMKKGQASTEILLETVYCQLLEELPAIFLCNTVPERPLLLISSANIVKDEQRVVASMPSVSGHWDPTLHRVLHTCTGDMHLQIICIRDLLLYQASQHSAEQSSSSPLLEVELEIESVILSLDTAPTHNDSHTPSVLLSAELGRLYTENGIKGLDFRELIVNFDGHDIFTVKETSFSQVEEHEKLVMSRRNCEGLASSHKAWSFNSELFRIYFPFGYNFALGLEEAQNCFKMLKLLHKTPKLAGTDELVYADCLLEIREFIIEFEDDKLEQRIHLNYKLMRDEEEQKLKRTDIMRDKIEKQIFIDQDGFQEEDYWNKLEIYNSHAYCDRHKKMIQKMDDDGAVTSVFTLRFEDIDLSVCADKSLNGHVNVTGLIKEIDPSGTIPPDMRCTTLWARWLDGRFSSVRMSLRNFSFDLWSFEDVTMRGYLAGAEVVSPVSACRETAVCLRKPWSNFKIMRGMNSLKIFHDLKIDTKKTDMAWGPCYEPTYSLFGQCLDKATKVSLDPSPLLPFWDKCRLLFRGNIQLDVDQFNLRMISEREPALEYLNEYMQITGDQFTWKWTNGVLDFTADDAVIKACSESKYGINEIVRFPDFNLRVEMFWNTVEDPNNHFGVTPTHPSYAKELPHGERWDSYENFRSLSLDLDINMRYGEDRGADSPPNVFLYSKTIKWLETWASVVMGTVSRPIRKGKIFGYLKPPKKKLTRHYGKIQFKTNFPSAEIQFWSSYRKKQGVSLTIGAGELEMMYKLELKPWDPIKVFDDDGVKYVHLKRRLQTHWETCQCDANFEEINIMLYGTDDLMHQMDEDIFADKKPPEHCLVTVSSVMYRQKEGKGGSRESLHSINTNDSNLYTHWMRIVDIKANLNVNTRSILVSIITQYQSAKMIKHDLSSEALRIVSFNEVSSSSPKQSKESKAFSRYSSSPNKSNDMLNRLVEDAVTIVSYDERLEDNPDSSHEKLAGETACTGRDITQREWFIEFKNGQIALQGAECKGFVMMTTGKCQVLGCGHKPVLRGGELFSKSSWVFIVEHVQYFATVSEAPDCSIPWLAAETISIPPSKKTDSSNESLLMEDGEALMGIVRDVYKIDSLDDAPVTQLQRVVCRCSCKVSFASYGTQPLDEIEGSTEDLHHQSSQELLSAFSLRHDGMEICTNPTQYRMVIDSVNNLILRTENNKQTSRDRMKYKIQLMNLDKEKARESVLKLQNKIRSVLRDIKMMERKMFEQITHAEETDYHNLENAVAVLKTKLNTKKNELNEHRDTLRLMISAFKETVMLETVHTSEKVEDDVIRKQDICIDQAKWTLTKEDGQISVLEVFLRQFLYSRYSYSNNVSHHNISLGLFHVSNQQPSAVYPNVLFPHDRNDAGGMAQVDRSICLRVFLKQRPPVGGINLNDHLEINFPALALYFEQSLGRDIQQFFFGKQYKQEDENVQVFEEDDSSNAAMHPINMDSRISGGRSKGGSTNDNSKRSGSKVSQAHDPNKDLDEMSARSVSKQFIFVKIPTIPIMVSYKGGMKGQMIKLREEVLNLPNIEYHNKLWTWSDLCMAIKKDCTKTLVWQITKEKVGISNRLANLEIPFPLSESGSNRHDKVDNKEVEAMKATLLMGDPESLQGAKKKGPLANFLTRKRSSKKGHKLPASFPTLPTEGISLPVDGLGEQCIVPGEWQEADSFDEKLAELTAISQDGVDQLG